MATVREEQTIRAMVEIYCHAHHASDQGPLCEECQALFEYAQARLGKCPFEADKPVCANCPIHCYQPVMRDQVRKVMRYAGPRMALRHPVLTLSHMLQKNRPVPERPSRKRTRSTGRDPAESNNVEIDTTEMKSEVYESGKSERNGRPQAQDETL